MLARIAGLGPWVLVAGLVVGLTLPGLAHIVRGWLPGLVVVLLFLASLRIAPAQVAGSLSDMRRAFGVVGVLQLGVPLAILAVAHLFGIEQTDMVLALVVMAAAPSISGSPNMSLMLGHSPEQAMRLLVLGTACLSFTVVPVFLLMPQLGTVETIIWTAFKLFVTIGASTLAAMVVRRFLLPDLSANARQSLDGVSATVLAVFVVGLMEAAARVLFSDPLAMLGWLVFACAANFGMQLAAYFALGRSMLPEARTAVSLVAGNRNIALFLVSLPPDVTAPLLVFIGCYQIPMYLTPLVMRPLYRGPH
ncbi:MAG: hypothetical protein ACJA1F_003368 [Paracoccaceae bacterium]|jgi:hypothetical protein